MILLDTTLLFSVKIFGQESKIMIYGAVGLTLRHSLSEKCAIAISNKFILRKFANSVIKNDLCVF